ncbi:MAG: SET domain-containing protein [Polyangiaceae bacterium]|nr:SET domain-containing protein [Myxococcales bacterium]MCB9584927.1 SET domain-containing protein [Polyangiaceae bacterium]MCB9607500.1 SET domain-containing protein [Polyangiaceae bacterium]
MTHATAPVLDDDDPASGYVSAKLRGDWIGGGQRGVFAAEAFEAGELVAVWGGKIMHQSQLGRLGSWLNRSVQIEDELYLVSNVEGPSDWINHSCDPNTWLSGQIALVASRKIYPGEQICYDYATTDGSNYDEFDCQCGAVTCRHHVSGDDWRRAELQDRYRGHFSPYLERRIEAINPRRML